MSTAEQTTPSSSALQEIDFFDVPIGFMVYVTTTSGSTYRIIRIDHHELQIEGGSYLQEGVSTAIIRDDSAIVRIGSRMYFEVCGLPAGFKSSPVIKITQVN